MSDEWPRSKAAARLIGGAPQSTSNTPQNVVDQIAAAMDATRCPRAGARAKKPEIQVPIVRGQPAQIIDMSSQAVIQRLLDQGYQVVEPRKR